MLEYIGSLGSHMQRVRKKLQTPMQQFVVAIAAGDQTFRTQAATLKNKNELEWNEEFEVQCGVRRVGLQIIPAQGHDREGLCFGWTNLSQDDLSWLTTRLGPQKIRLKGFDLQRPPHLWVEVKVDSARY
jgi:hypothetical protein